MINVRSISSDNTGRDIQKKTASNTRERLSRDLGQGHEVEIKINVAPDSTERGRGTGGMIATADHTDADLIVETGRKVLRKKQDQTDTGMNPCISFDLSNSGIIFIIQT